MTEPQEIKEFSSIPGLKDAAAKLKGPASPPVEQKVEPVNSVEPKAISDPGTEVVKQSETVADTPKEEPKIDQTTAVDETVAVEKAWDTDDSEEPKTVETPTFDFSKLGSALKLEGVKNESDIVTKFNELQTKLQEFETKKAATFEGVPDELKEVIDLAKSGADWKSFIGASTVDWSKVDPIDVYENEIAKLPGFRNADGTLNQEALDAALDSIPDAQKELEGGRMVQQQLAYQQQLKHQKIEQARQRKEKADKELLSAVGRLSEMFPEKEFGVKFEPRHSDELFKGISTGELMRQYFTDDNGNYDMNKVVETIAIRKYGKKMIKFQAEKAKVAAKKEILSNAQNVQLETTKTSVAPDDGSSKQLSAVDRMKKFVEQQKGVGHL